MRDAAAGRRQQCQIVVFQMDAMHADEARAEQAETFAGRQPDVQPMLEARGLTGGGETPPVVRK